MLPDFQSTGGKARSSGEAHVGSVSDEAKKPGWRSDRSWDIPVFSERRKVNAKATRDPAMNRAVRLAMHWLSLLHSTVQLPPWSDGTRTVSLKPDWPIHSCSLLGSVWDWHQQWAIGGGRSGKCLLWVSFLPPVKWRQQGLQPHMVSERMAKVLLAPNSSTLGRVANSKLKVFLGRGVTLRNSSRLYQTHW